MKKLYLIRHGMTPANEAHLYCGSTDLPLSDAGCQALSGDVISVPDARYFTSGMKRTDQTLRLLFGDVEFTTLPAFREIDFGAFEMHSYEALKDREDYQAWISGSNEENTPPGGESGIAMKKRVLDALPSLLACPDTVVLVTHGGVIAAIMEAMFPEDGKNRYTWQPKPGNGYLLEENGYREVVFR